MLQNLYKQIIIYWVYLLLISLTACTNRQSVENIQVNKQDTQAAKQIPIPPLPKCPGLIAFVGEGDRSRGDRAIYTMNSDGSNSKRLTHNTYFNNHPVWSPDGRYVAFHALASFSNRKNQIYIMDADGNNIKNISNNNEFYDSLPIWSPKSEYIAFTRSINLLGESNNYDDNIDCYQFNQTDDIYVMNADGTNQRKLSSFENREMLIIPVGWSKDGQKIFFHAYKLCKSETVGYIYAVNINESKQTLIAEIPQYGRYVTRVTLSPNSEEIAFEARDSDGDMEIYVMNADGSNRRQLTQNKETDEYPTWSPDSKYIAYSRRASLHARGEVLSIINVASGLKVIDLVSYVAPVSNLSLEKSQFAWSSNGKQILVRTSYNTDKVFTVNVDGSGNKQITTGEHLIANPRWQPVKCD